MKQVNLERLSTDDLWTLYAKVSEVLGQRTQQEKLLLEERLRQLRVRESGPRPYPPVLPKYFNPDRPSETWAGRGKRPRWVVAQLKAGRRLDDFRIRRRARAQVRAN
jgi:DNA-binding protein H-NS